MKSSKRPDKIWSLVVATLVLVIFLVGTIIFYSNRYKSDINDYTIDNIEKHVIDQKSYINSLLNDQFIGLKNIAGIMKSAVPDDYQTMLTNLKIINSNSGVIDYLVVNSSGNGALSDGSVIDISNVSSFQNCLLGQEVMVDASLFNSDSLLLLTPIYKGTKIIGALGLWFDKAYINSRLMYHLDENTEYFCIADQDKNVIFMSQSALGETDVYQQLLDDTYINTQLSENEVGTAMIVLDDGSAYYVSQTPLAYPGYQLVHYTDVIDYNLTIDKVNYNVFVMMLIILAAFLLYLFYNFYIVLSFKRQVDVEKNKLIHEKTELEVMHDRYSILAKQSNVIIYELDIINKTVYANESFEKMLGYKPVYHESAEAIQVHPDDRTKLQELLERLKSGENVVIDQLRFMRSDGVAIWCQLVISAAMDQNGEFKKILARISNIDKIKKETELMKAKSEMDVMTGLYNSETIKERIIDFLIKSDCDSRHALLIIDIDNFKMVNDQFGHKQGDMALKALAKTLKGLYRSSDLIGRLGGDEFMILLTNVGSIKNLKRIVNDTVVKIAAMEYEQMKAMALTCSIGVVLITDHSENFNTLYNQADIALYMAKWDGKNRYRIYSQRMDKELMLRVKNND